MSIDIYLPALPAMAKDFGTTPATVQLGLATTTIGMALGNIVVGALSDRFGRRGPLLITGLLMVLGASLASASFHIVWFLACCLMMGISASAVQVSGRGVIADLTRGRESTRAFSLFSSLVMMGPVIGPVGGVLILSFAGWRGIFVALAVFALIATIGVWAFVPESLTTEKRHSNGLGATLRGMGATWRNAVFRWYAVVNFCAFSLMFTYLGTCSLTIQVELGQPPWVAAAAFAVNGAAIALAGVLSASLTKRLSSVAILFLSLSAQVLGIVFLAIILATNALSVVSIFVIYVVICFGAGLSFGPVASLALTHMRKRSGTALGLMGLTQFLVGAVTSVFVGTINPSPAMSMLIIGSAVVAIAVIAAFGGRRALSRNPDPDLATVAT
jgi:DHA1 family bicyclomycin/chloramphenicol resistance-like MFS transporter